MTVAQQLATCWRKARWDTPDGKPWPAGEPWCPRCKDAADLQPGYAAPTQHIGIRSYYCRCCRYPFTDLVRSPMAKTGAPLVQWARLALEDPDLFSGQSAQRKRKLRAQHKRLRESLIGDRWRTELERAGVTLAQLRQAMNGRGVPAARRPGRRDA